MGPLECHSAPRTHLRSPHIKSHPNICSIYSVENIPITRLYCDQAKPLGTLQNTKFTTRHLPWVLQYAHVPKNTTSKNLILKNKNPHRKRVEPGSQDIRPLTKKRKCSDGKKIFIFGRIFKRGPHMTDNIIWVQENPNPAL